MRRDAFAAAIGIAVDRLRGEAKDARVLNLGCGAGLLAMEALRVGAARRHTACSTVCTSAPPRHHHTGARAEALSPPTHAEASHSPATTTTARYDVASTGTLWPWLPAGAHHVTATDRWLYHAMAAKENLLNNGRGVRTVPATSFTSFFTHTFRVRWHDGTRQAIWGPGRKPVAS